MLSRRISRSVFSISGGKKSKINILDEKELANENYFFSKQDEALLKKIFEAAQISGEVESAEGVFKEATTAEEKVKLVFMKNGIPPSSNPQLISDLVKMFETK